MSWLGWLPGKEFNSTRSSPACEGGKQRQRCSALQVQRGPSTQSAGELAAQGGRWRRAGGNMAPAKAATAGSAARLLRQQLKAG